MTLARIASALITICLSLAGSARFANAQSIWTDRTRISINAGAQATSSTFTATQNVPVYQQTATLTSAYEVPSGAFFDADVILRVSGGLGVDVGASSFTSSEAATITGTIPHPTVFGRLRPISGTTSPLERHEIGGHIDAAYLASAGRLDVAVAGGLAFFTVNQDLAADVGYAESPTFDRVTFTGATVSNAMATAIGLDAGIDVGFKLSKNVGVGAILRYSRASLTFPLVNTASGAHADAGGAHAGAGLRLYF